MIANSSKNKIFPLYFKKSDFEDEDDKTTPRDIPDLRTSESFEEGAPKDISDELYRTITDNDKIINKEHFKKYFDCHSLSDMQKELPTTKGTPTNEIVVDLIKDDLDKFKKESFKTPLSNYAAEYSHKTVHDFWL